MSSVLPSAQCGVAESLDAWRMALSILGGPVQNRNRATITHFLTAFGSCWTSLTGTCQVDHDAWTAMYSATRTL